MHLMLPLMIGGTLLSGLWYGIAHPEINPIGDDWNRPRRETRLYEEPRDRDYRGFRERDPIGGIVERYGWGWRRPNPQARLYERIEGMPSGYYHPPIYTFPRYGTYAPMRSANGGYRIIRDDCGARIIWVSVKRQTVWQRRTPGGWSDRDEFELQRMFRWLSGRY